MENVRIRHSADKCVGCKMCYVSCTQDVIRWNNEVRRPVFAYPEDCMWCLACEMACKSNCIEVMPSMPAPFARPF